MSGKTLFRIMFVMMLTCLLTLIFCSETVKASGTIYIRADGSIDPVTAPIQRDGDTYTLTDNVYDSIVVERDNIVVDGAGYTVQGTGASGSKGIYLSGRSNVTIKNTQITTFYDAGIWLDSSSNNSIVGNNITENNWYGIYLWYSSNNTVYGNSIASKHDRCGVYSGWATNNNVSGNNITNNSKGIFLYQSSNTVICGNNVTNNTYDGIYLNQCPNNTLRNNSITGNRPNFGVFGTAISQFVHDVDSSNTVDGKPIYYWVNRQNMEVSSDAGYVALVNCTGITVQNLNLTKNEQGILLAYSTNISIRQNTITNNKHGIKLYSSSNIIISGNNITNNWMFGISLESSSNYNIISGNNITENNWYGIDLHGSSDHNSIAGNNITNNSKGIYLCESSNNIFYHNNFIDNTQQVCDISWDHPEWSNSINVWDDGYPSGGNYWSDYTDVDLYSGPNQNIPGSDGIGDTPYVIDADNQDRYPLMNPWTPTETSVKVKGKDYSVTIESNTTLEQIISTSNKLHFKSSGPTGETGYILVIFPMVNTTEIKVFIDGGPPLTPPPFPVITSNGTHYFIYFEFTLSTHDIALQFAPLAPPVPVGGVWVPINKTELLAPWISLASLITAAIASVVYVKHKKKQKN